MSSVLVFFSLAAVAIAFFGSPPWDLFFIGTGITLAIFAHMAQGREQHEELLQALGYEQPSRREEFETARRQLEEERSTEAEAVLKKVKERRKEAGEAADL